MSGRIDSDEYTKARDDVRRAAASALELLDRVYELVESFVTAGPFEVTKLRGLRRGPIFLVLFLFAKALKTVRAVRAAALEGCGQDAMVLNRVLLETALAVTWILQRNTRRRGELFLAHQDQRVLVAVDAMAATPGLRRVSQRVQKDAHATIQQRWSGEANVR
jgi:hypothetical protein